MGATVELVRGDGLALKKPTLVLITSLFTYWWQPVWDSVLSLAFKKMIKNISDEKIKHILIAFPSWEKIYEIESLVEKFKLLNIKRTKIEKQISLDNF